MQPKTNYVRPFLFLLAGALLFTAVPARAQDAIVTGTLNYVSGLPGNEVYRYDYTLENVSVTPAVQTLLVFFDSNPATQIFDGSDDADFISATGPSVDWEVTPIVPTDPDAWYVEFANFTSLGAEPGDVISGFSVEFRWKNPNTLPPCEQFFEAINGRAHEGVSSTLIGSVSPRNGVLSGFVTGCTNAPLAGVTVDIFRDGTLIGSALTNASGAYSFSPLTQGGYTINVVTPIGYTIVEELPNNCDDGIHVNFVLQCQTVENAPRTIGYWKHQMSVHITGRGKAQETKTNVLSYLDTIYNHFHLNGIHPVSVYTVDPSAAASVKLATADDILTVNGSKLMNLRARQQLMALLLNVASLKLGQNQVISADGRTVNQAITYAWDLIADGNPANDETAKTIADEINNGRTLGAGIIPASTPVILYSVPVIDGPSVEAPVVSAFRLGQNYPNPMNPMTVIPFQVAAGSGSAPVRISIFDLSGRLVRSVLDTSLDSGDHTVTWDGTDDSGQTVHSGIYFYTLTSGGRSETRKLHVLK